MEQAWRVRDFAKIAGVTVKALYHYERRGLIRPHRTGARYRTYRHADLQAVREIRALRFLGFSLKQVKEVRSAGPASLLEAIRGQRDAIERKRRLLVNAANVLEQAEIAIRHNTTATPLKALTGRAGWVLGELERDARKPVEPRAPDRVSESKRELFNAFAALLDEDPSSAPVQALIARRNAMLLEETGGDPEAIAALAKPWYRRDTLPESMKRWIASLYETDVETWGRVADFIDRANSKNPLP